LKQFGIKKIERLKSKKSIDTLFAKGDSVFAYPLKLIYKTTTETDNPGLISFGISVPKRSFKRAVDRNLLKRRIREAYRLNNHPLKNHISESQHQLSMMFIYVGKTVEPYDIIEKGMTKVLSNLEQKPK